MKIEQGTGCKLYTFTEYELAMRDNETSQILYHALEIMAERLYRIERNLSFRINIPMKDKGTEIKEEIESCIEKSKRDLIRR